MPASKLHLSFEADAARGTILRVREQQQPWRVVRGFQTASGETLAHIHNVSGGILDTDALACHIEVGPDARAQVTSTGATRVYRSRSRDRVAAQSATVTIAAGGYLEYLPDQLIPFGGSRFEQTARIDLSRGASLIWWDRIAPGRVASGESFRYESLVCSFESDRRTGARRNRALDHRTEQRPPDSPARLGPFHHFASCYICRAGEPAAYWRKLETELQEVAEKLSGPEIIWGITSLRAHGLVARGVAISGRPLSDGLVQIWKAAKWSLCGRVATLPRKVH